MVRGVTAFLDIDAPTMTALERHETFAHAIPAREVRDQGDAIVLYDPRDADPFWNRMSAVRWPADPGAFDHRLAEAMAMFALLGRQPHVWPSPVHAQPADLVKRLAANGFVDIGGGHVMVLVEPAASAPVRPGELDRGITLQAIATPGDAGPGDLADAGEVLAAAFGAAPSRGAQLAADLERTLDDPRVVLVVARVDGVAAATAKALTFDGLTYLSSIGTLPGYRGRGLAGLTTRHALAVAGVRDPRRAYLGVFSGNETAIHLYERLGFRSVGESPDLLLE
jgi:ribosomal protein S18 acetylase RimI-like enzyme